MAFPTPKMLTFSAPRPLSLDGLQRSKLSSRAFTLKILRFNFSKKSE